MLGRLNDLTDGWLDVIELAAETWPADFRQVLTLVAEVRRLRGMVQGLADRVAAQSELLAKHAEGKP